MRVYLSLRSLNAQRCVLVRRDIYDVTRIHTSYSAAVFTGVVYSSSGEKGGSTAVVKLLPAPFPPEVASPFSEVAPCSERALASHMCANTSTRGRAVSLMTRPQYAISDGWNATLSHTALNELRATI